MIDVGSIGRFAALVIEGGAPFHGRRIDIASDEKTGPQSAAALGQALGEKLEYVALPLAVVREQSEDLALMFEWIGGPGFGVDIAALRRDHPEVGWATLEEWAPAHLGVESAPSRR